MTETNRLGRTFGIIFYVFIILILASSCDGGAAAELPPTPTLFLTPTIAPTSTPVPTRVNSDVVMNWGGEDQLDGKHDFLREQCNICHVIVDDIPPDEACLSCHEGGKMALTAATRNYVPMNPHDYHYGLEMECAFCHTFHETQWEPCGYCHSNVNVVETGDEN
ncbi:cytochrome c3 family protein [Chloroflexota bacterium]